LVLLSPMAWGGCAGACDTHTPRYFVVLQVTAYALESAQERGLMFVKPGDQVRMDRNE